MPNWCEGTLKVRGKVKDLKKFCLEALCPVTCLGLDKEPLKIDEFDCIESECDCHIAGTYRGFVSDLDVEFYEEDEETKVLLLDSRFAWDVDVEGLVKLCDKYKVDMKIYAFECGMGFNRDIEIINGEVVKDADVTFDNYEWECICPNMGG